MRRQPTANRVYSTGSTPSAPNMRMNITGNASKSTVQMRQTMQVHLIMSLSSSRTRPNFFAP